MVSLSEGGETEGVGEIREVGEMGDGGGGGEGVRKLMIMNNKDKNMTPMTILYLRGSDFSLAIRLVRVWYIDWPR